MIKAGIEIKAAQYSVLMMFSEIEILPNILQ